MDLKLKWRCLGKRYVLDIDLKQDTDLLFRDRTGAVKQDITLGNQIALTVSRGKNR